LLAGRFKHSGRICSAGLQARAPSAAANIFSLLWRLVAIYSVSFGSFRFIERPLLKLRSRFRHGVAV
jgi:peptidoglycan/LPS O-acetylase OafA/YrhL